MIESETGSIVTVTILALADIKAAAESFDRGEANAFDTMDAICVTVEAYRLALTSVTPERKRRQGAA